jgi:putative oxidoreductase
MAATVRATAADSPASGGKALRIGLWVVQVLLAAGFAGAGFAKVATPLPELAQQLPYTADLPGWLVRFIGASEIAGAIGVLVPALLRIAPILTPLASGGLLLVMVLASLFHAARGEWSDIPITLVLGALAAFVTWGRLKKAPIRSR